MFDIWFFCCMYLYKYIVLYFFSICYRISKHSIFSKSIPNSLLNIPFEGINFASWLTFCCRNSLFRGTLNNSTTEALLVVAFHFLRCAETFRFCLRKFVAWILDELAVNWKAKLNRWRCHSNESNTKWRTRWCFIYKYIYYYVDMYVIYIH